MEPVKYGPLLGMNNRLDRDKLSTEEGAFLADAVNVDMRAGGKFTARRTGRKILTATRAHSLWNNYFVDGSTLYRLDGSVDAPYKTQLLTGLTPGLQMSFTEHVGFICCSNSTDIWLIDEAATPFGIAPPAAQPTLSSFAGGGLAAGRYQVSLRYRSTATGEYSGATNPVFIECAEGAGINVSGILQRAGAMVQVFISPCNGTELFLARNTAASSINILDATNTGERLDTLFLTRLPPGGIVRSYNGRLLSAAGNCLHYTDAWSYLYNPAKNFIQFPAPITMVEPAGASGLYVSADQTYFIAGDLTSDASTMRPVLPYKALMGASGQVKNKKLAYWMSERGIVIGSPEGEVTNLQEDAVAVKPASHGAVMLREEDGLKQIVASTFNPSATVMAASTYMDAEVIHATPQ